MPTKVVPLRGVPVTKIQFLILPVASLTIIVVYSLLLTLSRTSPLLRALLNSCLTRGQRPALSPAVAYTPYGRTDEKRAPLSPAERPVHHHVEPDSPGGGPGGAAGHDYRALRGVVRNGYQIVHRVVGVETTRVGNRAIVGLCVRVVDLGGCGAGDS